MGSALNQYLAVLFGKYKSKNEFLQVHSFQINSNFSVFLFSQFEHICIFNINRMDWNRASEI